MAHLPHELGIGVASIRGALICTPSRKELWIYGHLSLHGLADVVLVTLIAKTDDDRAHIVRYDAMEHAWHKESEVQRLRLIPADPFARDLHRRVARIGPDRLSVHFTDADGRTRKLLLPFCSTFGRVERGLNHA